MKVLIVGGVAGGAGAATRMRRLSEDVEIILFEKGQYISYANCGLPYYLGGTITDRERLIVTKEALLRDRFHVDVRTMQEVIAIDSQGKKVTVKDHSSGNVYDETYDKLLLSPGARPKVFDIPGVNTSGIFTLRSLEDTFSIDDYIRAHTPKRAVIVGGGFIGVEMAENLAKRGMEVVLVEFSDQVLAFLDKEIVYPIHKHLRENGIKLALNTAVKSFTRDSQEADTISVTLSNQIVIDAGLVLMCTGVVPESDLASKAGLALGIGGSIHIDNTYRTSDPNIFAVGDAVSVTSIVSGKQVLIPLAGPANKQGREVAEYMLFPKTQPASALLVQGSSVVKVFDQIAAATGLSEKQLISNDIPYRKTLIHPASHATYYPGAMPLSMKMLFSPEGNILGAQAVGYEGVEKRMDVIATVLRLGGTVYDLEKLELCYAPPVSSAKDPVNMLGFTAANLLKGDVVFFYPQDVDELCRQHAYILDVSTPDERDLGTIAESVHIPLDELRGRLSEIPKDQKVYVFCRVGLRGYIAARILMQNGFDACNLAGGYSTYSSMNKEVQALIRDEEKLLTLATSEKAITSIGDIGSQTISDSSAKTIEINACGMACPGPIMQVAAGMRAMSAGERLSVSATDPAFASDIEVWCERTGNTLLSIQRDKGTFHVILQKGVVSETANKQDNPDLHNAGNDKTMVVFSGDLDKAIASFIIANGAAAMGRKVTMFFTFWGLNILRRSNYVPVKKSLIEKMFGFMMPRGSKKLGLSRMNMGGLGGLMIRNIMKKKNVQSLEELMKAAIESGVRVLACQMSMDVMGIKEEELIEGVELAGVATFLGAAEKSDTNLFI